MSAAFEAAAARLERTAADHENGAAGLDPHGAIDRLKGADQ